MYTVDTETAAIDNRPVYPPRPVGVAIRYPDGTSCYFAHGHPTNNNSTWEEARTELAAIWESGEEILFQNASFDLEVIKNGYDLPLPDWRRVHDTMFTLYLYNPHAKTLSLKPSAEQILGWKPEEQDKLKDWVTANVPGINKKKNPWGANIDKSPGDLCGEYAIGDVDRTFALYVETRAYLERNSMIEAYDRERELMFMLLHSEMTGMRVDMENLQADIETYQALFTKVEQEIFTILGVGEFNINSSAALVDVVRAQGMSVEPWETTDKGRLRTARDVLERHIRHPKLAGLLGYRGALKTALGTFMQPWELLASSNNGRLHTHWHQVRNPNGFGTRTGRISSSAPNFTNVPNEYAPPPEGYLHPPYCRQYLLPEEGHGWLKRDYSAQEIRILAHFEDGQLMRTFNEDPYMDPHTTASKLILEQTGINLPRSHTKQTAFSIVYGAGIKSMAAALNCSFQEADSTKSAYYKTFPGILQLQSAVKARGARGDAVRTLGGRLIFSEPAIGHQRFDYKLLNHLIQGSAGDVTKEGLIAYHKEKKDGIFLAQVYDEVNVSVPLDCMESESEILRQCMEERSVKMDVPLKTDEYIGTNWYDVEKG